MDTLWQIEMMGWLRATQGDRVVARFRTRKTAALLAYLAFRAHRSHPRDLLVELFWPASDAATGRTCLRVALSFLCRQSKSPGPLSGAVILADRANVQLKPASCATNVAQFEVALAAVTRSMTRSQRSRTRCGNRDRAPAAPSGGFPCRMEVRTSKSGQPPAKEPADEDPGHRG